MLRSDHMSDDSFEYPGEWWEPERPETTWPGVLRFDRSNGAVLSLIVSGEKPALFPPPKSYDILHGLTTSGRPVTLFRCFDRRSQGGLSGLREVQIFANAAIVGFHSEAADPLLSYGSATFAHLPSWWGRSGIRHDDSVRFPAVAVRYEAPDAVTLHENTERTVTLRPFGRSSLGFQATSIADDVQIEVKPAQPMPLSEITGTLHACGDLLSIASLSLCPLRTTTVMLPPSGDARGDHGTVHAVPIHKTADVRDPIGEECLFTFSDIAPRPHEVFGPWLDRAATLMPVRALYLSGIHTKTYIEFRLLALSQAVEAFHRGLYPGSMYMPQEVFDRDVCKPLRDAIPKTADPSLRASLRSRLRFGNEYSLRKRLTVLMKEHLAALEAVFPDPLTFVGRITNYRNDFTHHPPDPGPMPLESEDVLRCNFVLRTLLEFCFLSAMGFSTGEIAKFAARCATYKQMSLHFLRR